MQIQGKRTFRASGAVIAVLATVLGIGVASCSRPERALARAQAQLHRYPLTGKIASVNPSRGSLLVDMQPIPGYMGAMPMSYPVHESGVLSTLAPGDVITAELVVAGDNAYLDKIRVVQKAGRR